MRGKQRAQGFSLIELVLVLVIISVISVVIAKILFQGFQSFKTSENISEADWQGWIAVQQLVDDIHTIRSSGDISTITSTQLNFVDVNNSSVQYQWSGNTLSRNGVTLATGLTSFSLSYLNSSGAATSTASAVRYVVIALTATQGTLTVAFSTTAGIRGE